MTHDLWANLNVRMLDYLDSVTLADLVEQQNQRATAGKTSVAVLHDSRLQSRAKKPVVVNEQAQG
jgi:Rrf2 family iron-sulfur cluster assembly transcriptional regulator